MTQNNRMLRLSEVAERLGVSSRAVLRWIHDGDLPATRGGDRRMWLVEEKELENLLTSQASTRKEEHAR